MVVHLVVVKGTPVIEKLLVGICFGVERNRRIGSSPSCAQVNHGLAALTLLGGDHDHTVCSTGTVQRGGGRILQDGHRLDIGGVDGVQRTVVRHTIHNIQRVGHTGHGGDTTDLDAGVTARVTFVVHDLDTGGHTLQGLDETGTGNLVQLLSLDDTGRTGEAGFLGSTIRDNDGFIQGKRVVEDDVEGRLARVGHFLGFIPHKRNHEHVARLDTAERETTVQIRHDAVVRSLDHNTGTREGTNLVGNDTADAFRLLNGS